MTERWPATWDTKVARREGEVAPDFEHPGAWRGPAIQLETQIAALGAAGLKMAPGRTIDELLHSWSRDRYEGDPYNLLLFMYGSEVEAEPWGRKFCECGWNFDSECLNEAGDYVRAFTEILRITGEPKLVTGMSDDFSFDADVAEIRYTIKRQERVLEARIDSDWTDPEAVAAFIQDIENAILDDRHFWAADNGQASVLFFIADKAAASINALRDDILQRYLAVEA